MKCLAFARAIALLAAAASAVLFPAAHAETARPAVETFFQHGAFSGAALSPDARFLAVRVAPKGQSHSLLAVIDLATFKSQSVASFIETDIGDFRWVNNDRLVFDLTDNDMPTRDEDWAPGLYGVDRDGKHLRKLVEHQPQFVVDATASSKPLPWNTYLLRTMPGESSNDVFVVQPQQFDGASVDYVNLVRLNTLNGRPSDVDTPLHSQHWLFDEQGTPRISETPYQGRVTVDYNDPATGKWRKLAEFDQFSSEGFEPAYFSKNGELYVVANNGHDTTGLYRFDLQQNKIIEPPVVLQPRFDFDGSFVYTDEKLLGVRYMIDAEHTEWFDETMKSVQKTVDGVLPSTINRISVAERAETPFMLVQAYSDVQPDVFFLFNTQTGKLIKLGESRPEVDTQQMSPKDMVTYKARDGLDIPAYLTIPVGSTEKKNLPLVVLVHGGPWVRGGSWSWNPEVQFLASRGYAVLEPEFRGSTGFGSHHFTAGWKQWGMAMQDDVADGVKWAVAQGIADPQRVCIAGASYGGYATLMGLVKNPELYRCGFEWVGVTDINLMYSARWSDISKEWKKYGMPVLIGDQEKDAVQLKATSPIEQASHIQRPLLLAYGGADRRVPIVHGKKFYSAVKDHNTQVEWIEYPAEGHGWRMTKTNIDFWTRVEKFLDRNIGQH